MTTGDMKEKIETEIKYLSNSMYDFSELYNRNPECEKYGEMVDRCWFGIQLLRWVLDLMDKDK